jgi:hypothetical protein
LSGPWISPKIAPGLLSWSAADYGLVADYKTAVPDLMKALG